MKLRNLINGVMLLGAASLANTAYAQDAEQVLLRFKTNLYELQGGANAFHFYIGATEDCYVDVDCGFGATELEVSAASFNQDSQSIDATPFTGSVSEAGVVTIYGDPKLIDYLDLEGLYITEFECEGLTNIEILNLSHNQLNGLDLSHMTKLQALYIDDNPFSVKPFVLGPDKPDFSILSMAMCGDISESFNFSDYPSLRSVQAYSTPSLRKADISGCPMLLQFSVDATNVDGIDLSNNPNLLILNVSETRVTDIDLSPCPLLTEFYIGHRGAMNNEYKVKSLDVSKNTKLQRLFFAGNRIENIDLSNLTMLTDLSAADNIMKSINIDNNKSLINVDISYNNMDFVTLPADRNTFSEYNYEQHPFPMQRSYPVTEVLDFNDRVNRPGSTTTGALYTVSRENTTPALVDPEFYTWEDNKISFKPEFIDNVTDSVYVAFKNTALQYAILTTKPFMVKSADEYGKPSKSVYFRSKTAAKQINLKVGVSGASEAKPAKVYVDFGNGELKEFEITTSNIPAEANISGARAGMSNSIYIEEGYQISALAIEDTPLYSLDVTEAPTLEYLKVSNCQLPSIDLKWNRCLRSLDLDGNAMTSIDLSGANGNYGKNILTDIDLSNNSLTSVTTDNTLTWVNLNLSSNKLTELPTLKASRLLSLDASDNLVASIDLRDTEALEHLNISGNDLTEIQINDYVPLKSLDISRNRFSFAKLPAVGTFDTYTYAPQKAIEVPEIAPVVSLIDYVDNGNGTATEYVWRMADDNAVVPEGNIRPNDGRFYFSNPDLGRVYCTLSNAAFPDFAGDNLMRTTIVKTAPMPTHVWGTFTTEADGTGSIILTGAANNTTVYIDWSGEGDLEQYILKDTYTEFAARTFAGKQAQCLSYDENEGVTVLTLEAGKLSQADFSPMKGLIAFSISNADIDNVKLPSQSKLSELTLINDNINDLDEVLRTFPDIRYLVTSGNPFTSADLSLAPSLESFISAGSLETIHFGNPKMWNLILSDNNISEIDLTGAEAVDQLLLSNNKLAGIDISPLRSLRVLTLDGNSFTFATLPVNKGYNVYNYQNQRPIQIEVVDGKVDLSEQAVISGTATDYHWFIDTPYLDENDELQGEELYVNEEYTLENGVTTFLGDFNHVMCVMTNANFPDLYLTTSFVDVLAGVDDILADSDNDAAPVYYTLQGVRVDNPGPGLYIVVRGGKATKEIIR